MKELKLELKITKEQENGKVYIYKIGNYTIRNLVYEDGFNYISISTEIGEYIPDICCRDDFAGKVLGFEIQTTSYGSLSVEEIKKVVAGLEEATKVAEILTAEFVK